MGLAGWLWLAIVIIPIYWIVITSFKGQDTYFSGNPMAPPTSPTTENYRFVLESGFAYPLLASGTGLAINPSLALAGTGTAATASGIAGQASANLAANAGSQGVGGAFDASVTTAVGVPPVDQPVSAGVYLRQPRARRPTTLPIPELALIFSDAARGRGKAFNPSVSVNDDETALFLLEAA